MTAPDPEVAAMGGLTTVLAELGDEERGRVLRWAAEKYGVSIVPTPRAGDGGGGAQREPTDGLSEDEISAEAPEFQDFADLFHAAKPKTDADRALVAGYWLQALQRQQVFQAAQLNQELKHLGYAVGNITDALTSNQRKKPARIVQVRKSGTARQARKTYKLTHEGLVYVQGMLGHGG